MYDPEEAIEEIAFEVLVNGHPKQLRLPIPYDYDGQAILQLVMNDVEPTVDGDGLQGSSRSTPEDASGGLPSWRMDVGAFEDWEQRARDLEDIDLCWSELDGFGLTPGVQPGLDNMRTCDPDLGMLDETLDHDLRNAAIVANGTKAAFRAARETSGASQAALAEALGVNVRAVKRWETPGQHMPPHEARRLVESWRTDAVAGAYWHVRQAEELRDECHEAYTLVLYRSQEEFDLVLAPMLANAPSYHWQDALAEAQSQAIAESADDTFLDIDHRYTNFPGTRSYWRANAAARMAAMIMAERGIPFGFAYAEEQLDSLFWEGVWVPCADVQRIESANGAMVVCGMR